MEVDILMEEEEVEMAAEPNADDEAVFRIRATAEEAESVGLPMIKVRGDGRRTHLVAQQFINVLMSRPRFRVPANRPSNERLLLSVRGDQAKCAILIKAFEAIDSVRDMETSILQQYHDKGYAYFVIADDADQV